MFTLVVFKIEYLGVLLARNRERGLALIEDITQGIKTRTRGTDFGVWIRPDTYAIVTLDGGNRIRYLVSRITTYMAKDLATLKDPAAETRKIAVGSAAYPGSAKTAAELLAEAEKNLKPASNEST